MKDKLTFCTIADSRFLLETLTLHTSLKEQAAIYGEEFTLYVLCLDELAAGTISKLGEKNLIAISLSDLKDAGLLATKSSRKMNEFAWTCKASLVSYLLKNKISESETLTFMDSDIHFFADPRLIYEGTKTDWSILITPHWFSEKRKRCAHEVGPYNAGLVSFKNNTTARACVEQWRIDCIKWCYARIEDGKYTDQMYLGEWPEKYDGVSISTNPGVNTGTWSLENFREDQRTQTSETRRPLICYHFHGLVLYLNQKHIIRAYPVSVHDKKIYSVYIESLQRSYDRLRSIDPSLPFRFAKSPGALRIMKQHVFRWLKLG